ncbi:MAG: hypothetical protein DMG30_13630 [Acidobacteria bacterium]|nr:MAG: hypothetical protein DMG30_13630 [Acidobacteriota bacterium]
MDRRSFLSHSAVMTAALVGDLPNSSFAQAINNSSVASGSPSISRQFARWVAGLRYQDLPPAVIDRVRGVTLHALASALQGYSAPGGREAVQIVSEQYQGVPNGATILVHGIKATKGDAAFANAEMILAGGKWDTFRMQSFSPGLPQATKSWSEWPAILSPPSWRTVFTLARYSASSGPP